MILSEKVFVRIIPEELGRLSRLIELDLGYNDFYGVIPSVPSLNSSCSIGSVPSIITKLGQLQRPELNYNELSESDILPFNAGTSRAFFLDVMVWFVGIINSSGNGWATEGGIGMTNSCSSFLVFPEIWEQPQQDRAKNQKVLDQNLSLSIGIKGEQRKRKVNDDIDVWKCCLCMNFEWKRRNEKNENGKIYLLFVAVERRGMRGFGSVSVDWDKV